MSSGIGTVFFVMGVSGSGKSTLGKQLAKTLGVSFFEGDDYHPKSNVRKMSQGIALTDTDRLPWLQKLRKIAGENRKQGCVISCSALKASYREVLSRGLSVEVAWIFLDGDYDTILGRLRHRAGHFMPAELLKSQFETLEPPEHAIRIPVDLPIEKQVELVLS
ncbi:MAG: gluconokinase, partial [Eudoraea sp.]|nr:gluconokinase [Eudoraea sp.]NNK30017.1 gluconokinase [Flavobacteriaceae bacterium]